MGLQNQLSDVSSESILIVTVVLIAKTLRFLHSLLFAILHTLSIISSPRIGRLDSDNPVLIDEVGFGSGLAGLIVLCEQLDLNPIVSYPVGSDDQDVVRDCVVCLNQLVEGDSVRELECSHVFHKDCFDGWLDHLNFNCPTCRAPVVSDELLGHTQRRVTEDLLSWFSFQ